MQLTKQYLRGLFFANVHWILLIGVAFGAFIYILGYVDSCNSKKFERKTEEQKADINQGKGAAVQIEEQRNETKEDIRQADTTANAAAGNFNAVLNTDSGSRDSSWSSAKREWCKDHRSDSKCQQ